MFIIIIVLSFLGICTPSVAMEQQDSDFDTIVKNYQLIKTLCSGVGKLRQDIANTQHPGHQRIQFGRHATDGTYPSIYSNIIPNSPNEYLLEQTLKYLFMGRLQAQPEDFGKAYSLVNKVFYQTREVYDNFAIFVHDYTLKTFETYLEANQFTKAYSLRDAYKDTVDTGMLAASKNIDWLEILRASNNIDWVDRVKEKVKLRLDDLAKESVLNAHMQQEREDTARNLIGLMPLDLQAEYESHFDRRKVEFTTLPEDAVVLRLQRQLEERLFGNQ